jgi:S1-C subfamily serine protease
MKILLAILSCVLVVSSTLSGFFIYNLNQRINELELNVENQFVDMTREIELTRDTFSDMLGVSQDKYELALADQAASLNNYQMSTDNMVSAIQDNITSVDSKVGSINTQVSQIRNNVLFSGDLYERVEESLVAISDGKMLLGSGFLLAKSKKIVTAYHVVKDVKKHTKITTESGDIIFEGNHVNVTFSNGKIMSAYIETYSEELDIAVLSIPFVTDNDVSYPDHLFFKDFYGVDLAESNDVRPGDVVFVVGSPGDGEDYRMGLKGTLTTGVISQINRCSSVEREFRTNLFQFDAAVNFGSSGSPLFNNKGEVIGIVIARMNPLIGDGIGMAVSSNQITKVINSTVPFNSDSSGAVIIEKKYSYPWSGITVNDLMPGNAGESVRYTSFGALVISVNGPATQAGVQIGDIITGIDEIEIRNSDEFYCFLAEYYDVGDTITLKIWRGEENIAVNLVLQENL